MNMPDTQAMIESRHKAIVEEGADPNAIDESGVSLLRMITRHIGPDNYKENQVILLDLLERGALMSGNDAPMHELIIEKTWHAFARHSQNDQARQ